MLKSARDFTTLPSERSPGLTPAGRLIRRLAERACHHGPNGFGSYGDRARRNRRCYQSGVGWDQAERRTEFNALTGETRVTVPPLPFELQPGAFIERRPAEERAVLRALTSDDIAGIELERNSMVADWEWYGPALHSARTIWRARGSCPERNP